MNELWLFIVHNGDRTWTRAKVPLGIHSVNELINYVRRGGKVEPIKEELMDIPERAKFIPSVAGMTVLARLVEQPFSRLAG